MLYSDQDLFLGSSQKLISQGEYSSSDTTWIYDFQSETDSAFSQIKFHAEYDSADVHITALMNSDQLDKGWKLGTKFWNKLNNHNKLSIQYRYSWNVVAVDFKLTAKMFNYYGEVSEKDYTSVKLSPRVDVQLYPVPVRDFLWIESEVVVAHIYVIDLNGRMVFTTGQVEEGVNLSPLSEGIYVVQLMDRSGVLIGTRKIVKE